MALRHNRKKKLLLLFSFFSFRTFEKRIISYGKNKNIEIKAKDKMLMEYQKNFTRKLNLTKKRLESILAESEQKLGLYKECLTKNIPLQVTSISGRII